MIGNLVGATCLELAATPALTFVTAHLASRKLPRQDLPCPFSAPGAQEEVGTVLGLLGRSCLVTLCRKLLTPVVPGICLALLTHRGDL